ncbi:mediator of RNA polymerase II transcription subunit 15 [Drosophila elegans]|uniref:mediator of RNA polymerase II transcription subunit 15 n=1 Tax=Drosophila elegans TaxID=30023 RepID=UPI0007E78A2D|nr:mediator of RNA polymerase II transcription subunit 15 [Drosophila elegans]
MRGFLLLCFIASVSAAKLGYNYQAAASDRRFAGLIDAEATGFSSTPTQQQQQLVQQESQQQRQQQQQQIPAAADEFSKEFFTYTAPEEEFADREATEHIASMLKRNLRVLFIKSPEHQGLTNAALQLAKQASEQRTAIYVLSKQADIGQLAQRLATENQAQSHKPEVHFVKYRTPEDAVRAQQLIQQQFDSLGGSSRSSDEGVAPVLDFSSAPAAINVQEQNDAQNQVQAVTPLTKYLPAALLRSK